MNKVIQLPDGKQIVIVSEDTGKVRLSIWANQGSLGIEIDETTTLELSKVLWRAVKGPPSTS